MKEKQSRMMRILKSAELIDALRVVPRLVLGLYAAGLYWILDWYTNYELQYVTNCDSATMNVLLREGVPIKEARDIACSVAEVIGHPTGYTVLVSTVVGAAAIVFGLYTKSGRNWEGDNSMVNQSNLLKPPSGFEND